ncbi:hypothetical protein B0T24DRAFT_623131 [Lasiosphaeria ovina]|uniref:Uncharacterized protein n=1 Tax=Lasiosphaeria ovina TaxID=92902 RepID=A0AAE0KC38_9PEZI|nr:hypothetical protein B0T24DRAFT_623131 [Lasiosphaeria ovina]
MKASRVVILELERSELRRVASSPRRRGRLCVGSLTRAARSRLSSARCSFRASKISRWFAASSSRCRSRSSWNSIEELDCRRSFSSGRLPTNATLSPQLPDPRPTRPPYWSSLRPSFSRSALVLLNTALMVRRLRATTAGGAGPESSQRSSAIAYLDWMSSSTVRATATSRPKVWNCFGADRIRPKMVLANAAAAITSPIEMGRLMVVVTVGLRMRGRSQDGSI